MGRRPLPRPDGGRGPRRRKLILAAAAAVNLALLAYFKYRSFFFSSMDGLFGLLGMDEPLPALRVLLPVGVSFYTFAGISYAVDVYRGTIRPARSVLHYLAWATLSPYLMAGPIICYGHVGAQLERAQQRFRLSLVGSGLFFLAMGLAEKALVADTTAAYVNQLFVGYPTSSSSRAGESPWDTHCSSTSTSRDTRTGPSGGLHDRPALPSELQLAVQG
ncbi:MAG TPA: hypothetical protein PLJ89_10975, partial [Thermoleophilia bacterium]|nr:hypothetical protein [Thermoleophilia bacterium]